MLPASSLGTIRCHQPRDHVFGIFSISRQNPPRSLIPALVQARLSCDSPMGHPQSTMGSNLMPSVHDWQPPPALKPCTQTSSTFTHAQNVAYRPEKEIIRYKTPIGRRLVVEGIHKEALIQWLEVNASFEELENIFFMLCEIRNRFSLRIPLSHLEMGTWKKRLQDNFEPGKHLGERPGHWWDED
jgi:hypothetical protein